MQSIAAICLGVAVVFSYHGYTVQGQSGPPGPAPGLYEVVREILESAIRSDSEGNTRVFVGRLSLLTTELDLYTVFEKYGTVENVSLPKRPRGYAIVTFKNSQEAQAAVDGANGTILRGYGIAVNFA